MDQFIVLWSWFFLIVYSPRNYNKPENRKWKMHRSHCSNNKLRKNQSLARRVSASIHARLSIEISQQWENVMNLKKSLASISSGEKSSSQFVSEFKTRAIFSLTSWRDFDFEVRSLNHLGRKSTIWNRKFNENRKSSRDRVGIFLAPFSKTLQQSFLIKPNVRTSHREAQPENWKIIVNWRLLSVKMSRSQWGHWGLVSDSRQKRTFSFLCGVRIRKLCRIIFDLCLGHSSRRRSLIIICGVIWKWSAL